VLVNRELISVDSHALPVSCGVPIRARVELTHEEGEGFAVKAGEFGEFDHVNAALA